MHCLKEGLNKQNNINITAGGNCLNEPTRAVEAAITTEYRGEKSSFHLDRGLEGWTCAVFLLKFSHI